MNYEELRRLLIAEHERCEKAESALAAVRRKIEDTKRIMCDSEIQCNHIDDDEPNECGDIDDCIFHAILQASDEALKLCDGKALAKEVSNVCRGRFIREALALCDQPNPEGTE